MEELLQNLGSMEKYQVKEENINLSTNTNNPISIEQKSSIRRNHNIAFGNDPFSDDEQRRIRQKLDTGLSRDETMQRPGPGGIRITYIEGWKVIHDANQIFGFNGWSSQIVNIELRFLDESRGRYSACVSATVRITLRDGCTREDRGGGLAENMRSKGEALLKAEKEAITDATKRTLKNFGLRLGLSLYDKQYVRDMNKMNFSKDIPTDPNQHHHHQQQQHQQQQQQLNSTSNPRSTPQMNLPRYTSNNGTPQSNINSNHASFQPDQSSNPTNTNSNNSTSCELSGAMAAQVATKRKEAILRQQAYRARVKQVAAAANPNLSDKGFQNQLMQMNGMMMQIGGQQRNVPPRSSSAQTTNSNTYDGNPNTLSNRTAAANSRPLNTNNIPTSTEQDITKHIRQPLHANMAGNVGFPPGAQQMHTTQNGMQPNTAQARVTGTATGIIPHQTGDVSLELSATINRRRKAAQNGNNSAQREEAIAQLSLKQQTDFDDFTAWD